MADRQKKTSNSNIYLSKLFSLKDKVVLITGGYGLLGERFANALAKAGARVVIGGRDYGKAKEASRRIDCHAVELDVTDEGSISRALMHIMDQYNTIDGLLNNASFSNPVERNRGHCFHPMEDLSYNEWRSAFEVDVDGMFLCSRKVGKIMAERGKGVIVNVSSIYGLRSPDPRIYNSITDKNGRPFIKSVGYCAAKGAIVNLTKYLAVYWREKGIRVNTLVPGGVYDGQDEEFVKAYSLRTPLHRMADIEEFNGAIIYLFSDASSYMTGATMVIDGGWTAW